MFWLSSLCWWSSIYSLGTYSHQYSNCWLSTISRVSLFGNAATTSNKLCSQTQLFIYLFSQTASFLGNIMTELQHLGKTAFIMVHYLVLVFMLLKFKMIENRALCFLKDRKRAEMTGDDWRRNRMVEGEVRDSRDLKDMERDLDFIPSPVEKQQKHINRSIWYLLVRFFFRSLLQSCAG